MTYPSPTTTHLIDCICPVFADIISRGTEEYYMTQKGGGIEWCNGINGAPRAGYGCDLMVIAVRGSWW